jgi:hypothetical protein
VHAHLHAHCMCKADWRAEESELQMGSQRMNVCMCWRVLHRLIFLGGGAMRRCMCYWNIDALADEFIQFCCMQVDARTGYMALKCMGTRIEGAYVVTRAPWECGFDGD